MKKKVRTGTIIIIALVILAFLGSPRLRQFLPWSGDSRASTERDPRLAVSAVVVRPQGVSNKVRATGTVLADEEVELRSEISGKVEKIHFSEGSRVRRGDLLIKIDDSELQAEREKFESQVNLAQDKERRRRLLYEKQNISPEDYEIVLNELNAIKAELQLVQARIQKTEIRAPFDGIIGLRYVSEGSYVSSTTRIASLQNVRRVKIDFSVPERYVRAVRKGQVILFKVAGHDEQFEGRIFAIEPKIDPATRSILLRAVSPNDRGLIVPGGFAELELVLETFPDALMVPTQALVPDDQGQKVYLYRGGVAEEARVETGLRTETEVQITSGIAEEDTVLTSGLLQVVSGTPLKLTEVR
jgi:membrane fusion protein (multidrug efflux system)